eukprot:CFRG8373T1
MIHTVVLGLSSFACTAAMEYDATVRAWGHFTSAKITGNAVLKQWYQDEPVEISIDVQYGGTLNENSLSVGINTLAAASSDCSASGLSYDPFDAMEAAYEVRCIQNSTFCSLGDLSRRLLGKSFSIHRNRGSSIACATIKENMHNQLIARFTGGDVVGTIKLSPAVDDTFGDRLMTRVFVNLINKNENFHDYRWYIRNDPVPNDQNRQCMNLGSIYDPSGYILQSYTSTCEQTSSQCTVGDQLRRRERYLKAQSTTVNSKDQTITRLTLNAHVPNEYMPLYGKDTVIGRSIVILQDNTPIACAVLQAVDIKDPQDVNANERDPRQFLLDNGVLDELEHEYNPHGLRIALGVLFGIIGLVLLILLIIWDIRRRTQTKKTEKINSYSIDSASKTGHRATISNVLERTKWFIKSKKNSQYNAQGTRANCITSNISIPNTHKTVAERSYDFFSNAAAKLMPRRNSNDEENNCMRHYATQSPQQVDEELSDIPVVTYKKNTHITRGETSTSLNQFENMTASRASISSESSQSSFDSNTYRGSHSYAEPYGLNSLDMYGSQFV